MDLPDRHVGHARGASGGGRAARRRDGRRSRADALRGEGGALDRLRPDLASLSVVHPNRAAACAGSRPARAMRVQVRGAGRVGAVVAAVLSAAGVGRVDVLDGGACEPWDVAPGGLPADRSGSAGTRRPGSWCAGRRRTRPPRPAGPRTAEGGTRAVPGHRRPAGRRSPSTPPIPAAADALVASGTPHLYAGVVEATGVVGPLVLPGGTGCAGCLAVHRAERDPAWPRMLAQWRSGRPRAACRPAIWVWRRRWPAWPRPTRCPFSTGSCPRARAPAGRSACRCWTGSGTDLAPPRLPLRSRRAR